MNIDLLKLKALCWFERGRNKTRTDEEINAYLEAIEDSVVIAYESLGRYSTAVYNAYSSRNAIEEYFEFLKSKE